MESKAQQYVDNLSKEACREQGGAYRDQGPNSVGGSGSTDKNEKADDRGTS